MSPADRKDLYFILTGLSDKLSGIAESTDDFETADRLYKLVSVIDDSADQLNLSRKNKQ